MDYSKLVDVYEGLSSTTSLLKKREIIAQFLKDLPTSEIEPSVLLLEGRVFPEWDQRKIGVGRQLVIKAISVASGQSETSVKKDWVNIGDLGMVAEKNISSKTQATLVSSRLTIKHVFDNLKRLAEIGGSGSVSRKVNLIAELLSSSGGTGAKYIVRTCLDALRTGAALGVLRDAIAKAYGVDVKKLQSAYDLSTDLAAVAKIAKLKGNKGLEKSAVIIGHPIKVMLFQRAEDVAHAFKIVGKPAAFEYKYDGFRLQVHNDGKNIKLFTRRLDEVTRQFPDIVSMIRRGIKAKKYILDCEIMGYDSKSKRWKPFQDISQRIKRKYDIDELIKKIPVKVVAFDIMLLDGELLLDKPFKSRRTALKKIIKGNVILAKEIITDDVKKAENFYRAALSKGAEGVMAKKLDGVYKPGSRVGYGIKIKPVMETLDLAIVGAEWGTGKRARWLSSFILACRKGDKFVEIGKMGTGIKEKEGSGVSFGKLTTLLKPLIISENHRVVKIRPEVIIEVAYEEIQKSTNYKSGYALRFPRLVRLRETLSLSDVDSVSRVKNLFSGQRGRK